MNKKRAIRTMAVAACGVLCVGALPLSACGKRDSIVIMAEEFSGLFNPFYATSGSDMDVVGLTQISMLTTDASSNLVCGDKEATVVKDYEISDDGNGNSVYTFVIKNGLKFSDGVPLTMNDVMFNIYEYLDPVYTGSSTMYSVKIKGLSQYRTQTSYSGDQSEQQQDSDSLLAYTNGQIRRQEIIDVFRQDKFHQTGTGASATYYATPDDMRAAIKEWNVSSTYKEVVSMKDGDTDYNKKLLDDYNLVLETFEKELNSDFSAARESFDVNTAPYDAWKAKFTNEKTGDIFKFFLYEGYIKPKYALDPVTHKEDKSKIESFENESSYIGPKEYDSQEKAIKKVFGDYINASFDVVLTSWGTAGDVLTKFAAEAKEVILNGRKEDGKLLYPNVEGIESLGHTGTETSVVVNKNTYAVAKSHNADGTPANPNEYDVLRITLDGKDPKAKYNFSFTVAPVHYYSGLKVDIANNEFGVEYGSASFQSKTIQSQRNVEVPLGAGPYKASNSKNSDTPTGADFWNNNFVYYKANHNFMFPVKTEKLRYRYISSANALDSLERKDIDFVTPQFTRTNDERVEGMKKKGFSKLFAWQLGYGYIGINAGKVKNVNTRRAIMSAMQAKLATEYYSDGTCDVINWPMSNQSWAYPDAENEKDYLMWSGREAAIEKIVYYTREAVKGGEQNFTYKFTIAGASISEHPTYAVFKQAVDLFEEANLQLGDVAQWKVEVKADSQALTKLATGSLEVWAAAWGSTIDPDMYQVYHKNSTATSVYAWGYREILANQSTYSYEYDIIANKLSPLIDKGRTVEYASEEDTRTERSAIYKEAMGYVLDLAVEMPVYQRMNLYAYNNKRVGGINENVNPFTSPLEKIWNIELL